MVFFLGINIMIYIKIRREAIKICIYIVNIYKSESKRKIRNTRATALATLRALCIFFQILRA